jgi:ferredoxin
MRLEIDPYSCVSSGHCVLVAPTVFDQNPEDGRVLLLTEHPAAELTDKVDDAIFRCPSQAIEWAEED